MDANQERILKASARLISKLQLMAVFFEQEVIYKIYLRTQVIHRLFEVTPDLDIHKLELFHLQFTSSILELLKKIKTANEQNVSLMYDEITLNTELINKLAPKEYSPEMLDGEARRQARKMSISLRKLFSILSADDEDAYPFSNNIWAFGERFAAGFYDEVPADVLHGATVYTPELVYTHKHAVIQRKLMGLLAKHDFEIRFFDGVKSGSLTAEIYEIPAAGKYFLFVPGRNLLLLCTPSDINAASRAGLSSRTDTIVQDLKTKNMALAIRADRVKTELHADIATLLHDYHQKIGDADFLQNIANFDVEANILRAMLNTNTL